MLLVAQQINKPCSRKVIYENYGKIIYENHNQIDYKIVLSNKIEGKAVDSNGNLLADVCITIFTEKGHSFVAQTIADKNGHFKFHKIPKGQYRLIGNLYPYHFCTANAQIRIIKGKLSKLSKNRLVLHLQSQGIDSCSYFDTK